MYMWVSSFKNILTQYQAYEGRRGTHPYAYFILYKYIFLFDVKSLVYAGFFSVLHCYQVVLGILFFCVIFLNKIKLKLIITFSLFRTF